MPLDSHTVVVAVPSNLDISELKISPPSVPVQNVVALIGSLDETFLNLDILPSSISEVPFQYDNVSCFGSGSMSRHSSLSDGVVSELECLRSGSGCSRNYICDYPPCQEETEMICCQCEKKSYCSRDHQNLDWNSHQGECTPPLYWHDPHSKFGWVVKMNYDVGGQEILLAGEEPFVILPSIPQSKDAPICINCGIVLKRTIPDSARPTTDPATCIVCRWPACENGCKFIGEENALNLHSVGECMELRKAQLREFEWSGHPTTYQYLWILRIALMKRKDPVTFAKMLQLANFNGEESDRSYNLRVETKIMLDRCLPCILALLSDTELDQVSKILSVKFRPMHFLNTMPEKKLNALYFESSIISHSCYPNLQYFTDESYHQSLVTLRPIQKGELLTINYVHELIFRPTVERRRYLLKRFNIWCTCQRCEDPSEFGTYFSSPPCRCMGICTNYPADIEDFKWPLDLVAPVWKPNNFLQPVNPKDILSLQWTCPDKLCKSKILRDIDILYPIEDFLKKIKNTSRDSIPEMFAIIGEVFHQRIIHCTHYAFFEASFRLLEMASDFITKFGSSEFFADQYYAHFLFAADCVHNIFKAFVPRGVRLSNRVLRVSSIIRLAILTDAVEYETINLVEAEKRLADIYNTIEPANLSTIKTFQGFGEEQNLSEGSSSYNDAWDNFDIAEQEGIDKFVKQVDIYISKNNFVTRFLRKQEII